MKQLPDLARKIIWKYQTIIGDLRRQINATALTEGQRGVDDAKIDEFTRQISADAIEVCAKLAELYFDEPQWNAHSRNAGKTIAAALRKLADPSQHPSTMSRSPSGDQGGAA